MGHKANITSLGFHPFGDFLASSSMDTNIKVGAGLCLCVTLVCLYFTVCINVFSLLFLHVNLVPHSAVGCAEEGICVQV